MQLLVGFSIVGSVLTLVGIYGVLSLSVAARRREIAIRTAVGARQSDIRKLIFGEGFRLIAGGLDRRCRCRDTPVARSQIVPVWSRTADIRLRCSAWDSCSPPSRCWHAGRLRAGLPGWMRWKR